MDLRKRRPLAGPQPFRAAAGRSLLPRPGAGPGFARRPGFLPAPPRPVAPARRRKSARCERRTP